MKGAGLFSFRHREERSDPATRKLGVRLQRSNADSLGCFASLAMTTVGMKTLRYEPEARPAAPIICFTSVSSVPPVGVVRLTKSNSTPSCRP